jgi:PIN domain nuclease of toxin-antitoxin system
VKLLLDTHILLWAAGAPDKLSDRAKEMLLEPRNSLFFSAASIWEVVIKQGLGREDFRVDAPRLRKKLVVQGYVEVPVNSEHVLRVATLPLLHKDPFDRILVAQARCEGMALLSVDAAVVAYGEGIIAA